MTSGSATGPPPETAASRQGDNDALPSRPPGTTRWVRPARDTPARRCCHDRRVKGRPEFASQEYQYGFSTDLDTDAVPKGLSEDVIRLISAKKHEPDWLLEWRLRAYRHWITLEEPHWQNVHYGPIDYQDIIYYAAPKPKSGTGEPR
jgi:hypothetical protein